MVRGEMDRFKKLGRVAQRMFTSAQSAEIAMKCEHSQYRNVLAIQEQWSSDFEALLPCLFIRLVDHMCFVDSVWDFYRQNVDGDPKAYLLAVFTAFHEDTAGFRFATSNVVDAHTATLRQDVLVTLRLLDCRLVDLTSEPSATTTSNHSSLG